MDAPLPVVKDAPSSALLSASGSASAFLPVMMGESVGEAGEGGGRAEWGQGGTKGLGKGREGGQIGSREAGRTGCSGTTDILTPFLDQIL